MDHQRQPAVDFDHHTAQFAADPDRQWRELRQKCPIAWTEAHGGYWVVSDYRANHEVLKNHAVFTTERLLGLEGATTVLIPQVPTEYRALPEEIDPPAHTPVRRMLNAVSSPAAAAAMIPRIRHWVTRHIDAVIESGACDFAYDIASPVPAHITFEWLGLPLKHAKVASEAFHDMLGYPPGHGGSRPPSPNAPTCIGSSRRPSRHAAPILSTTPSATSPSTRSTARLYPTARSSNCV